MPEAIAVPAAAAPAPGNKMKSILESLVRLRGGTPHP
jgi:hypothetical protein